MTTKNQQEVCMMETMLSKKGLNFNALEKEIFKIGCEVAAALMTQALTQMDKHLEKNRDRKIYRHKGTRTTTLKTLMGEVIYDRVVYETKLESGEKAYIYLLDQMLELDTFGKVTANLASRIAESISVCSYRETASNVSSMTGQSISHGGAWNVIQDLGEKLSDLEKTDAQLAKEDQGRGEVVTPILFEEADGVWINMQGEDRPKKGRKCEMKMAAAYDGWESNGKSRYTLRNKIVVCGFEESKDFQRKKEGAIASVFDTDEVEIRILNGDGGGWIKGGLVDANVHFQLDPFHKNREIIRKVKDKNQRETVMRLLSEKRVDDLLLYLRGISELAEDEKEKKKLTELCEYFRNNKEGLIPYQERGLKIPVPPEGVEYRNLGTMEHHVCDGAAKRMKHQKASWTKEGAGNLGRILCKKVCGNLGKTVTSLSKTVLPERYTESIERVLSSAKSPLKDGKGYLYPSRGSDPFIGSFVTNGRKAILGLISDRKASDLIYR
ncbi:MAG: ISLre2 family transposase [Bacteroidia bacterium]|nr:ISLre2 family transposase [Bacteroidia bacterium]